MDLTNDGNFKLWKLGAMELSSDGSYSFTPTELVSLRYCLKKVKADWTIYVVDSTQEKHFQELIKVAKQAGWTSQNGPKVSIAVVTLHHPNDEMRLSTPALNILRSMQRSPYSTRQGGWMEQEITGPNCWGSWIWCSEVRLFLNFIFCILVEFS
ncbi:hypothetical protein AQUCO_01300789v1 [Aquilegia coerulea]|uniref:Arginyl-tRNA synthetase catalytic core domain-containing protein n=1 Tax=Aquilegia coerulea TaxID=218851 RepID=A0A2G5E3E6_AQUCA|nr:hypothetical protein AQUCO_01300789v1 [Aquilegia coerulea]